MKFVAQVKGNIAEYMKLEAEGGARAASRVMGEETRRLQLDLRSQVSAAFGLKGRSIGNAWRAQTFPRSRPSLGAAGLVWSKVPAIVDAFEKGAMIRPKGGKKFLAIPTGFNADRGRRGRGNGGMRVTPAQMVASKQAFMRPFKSGKGFVWCLPLKRGENTGKQRRTRLMAGGVAEVGTGNRKGREAWARGLLAQGMVPMFLLLPAVKLPKRLDIRKPAEQAAARIPGRFVAEWDKEVRANVRT
ncbi:MAG: hypothetical protein INF89_10260 [Roseomonas sp.]|nr:hypothetical protein [Roseomonas sp.]